MNYDFVDVLIGYVKLRTDYVFITSQCKREFKSIICVDSIFFASETSSEIEKKYEFISTVWAEAWFGNQHYKKKVKKD